MKCFLEVRDHPISLFMPVNSCVSKTTGYPTYLENMNGSKCRCEGYGVLVYREGGRGELLM